MGAAQLILVEGMIGSGKTTTPVRVGDWLARQGENARVFREGDADHPVRTRAEDRLRAAAGPRPPGAPGGAAGGPAEGSSGDYPDDQWRRLAERCLRGRQAVVLEGSFLQNSVMPAFIDGAPARTVSGIFTGIVRQAAPAEPLLVYLRPADIGAAIARVHRVRGEPRSSRNVAFVEASARCPLSAGPWSGWLALPRSSWSGSAPLASSTLRAGRPGQFSGNPGGKLAPCCRGPSWCPVPGIRVPLRRRLATMPGGRCRAC